jgi:hypothetical protein
MARFDARLNCWSPLALYGVELADAESQTNCKLFGLAASKWGNKKTAAVLLKLGQFFGRMTKTVGETSLVI